MNALGIQAGSLELSVSHSTFSDFLVDVRPSMAKAICEF